MSDSALPPITPPLRVMAVRVLAIIGGIALLWVLGQLAYFLFVPRQAPAQIEAKAAKQVFAVAEVNPLAGTDLNEIVIATDISIRARGDSYSSGGGNADERNVILLDKASGASRKLLPDNGRQILTRLYLPAVAGPTDSDANDFVVAGAGGEKVKPPIAYYLLRVRAAQGLSEDVLIGDIATGRQAFLLTGIDGVDRIWMQSPTRLGLLMRQGRKLHYRAIEIPALKVVAARPVEID